MTNEHLIGQPNACGKMYSLWQRFNLPIQLPVQGLARLRGICSQLPSDYSPHGRAAPPVLMQTLRIHATFAW
jgi:hypothetical protein